MVRLILILGLLLSIGCSKTTKDTIKARIKDCADICKDFDSKPKHIEINGNGRLNICTCQ